MLEGTMTGGAVSLRENNMVCLAGGDKDDFENNKWFMAHSIGPVVVRCGEIGTAAVAKVASNMLAFLNMAGGIEVGKLCKKTLKITIRGKSEIIYHRRKLYLKFVKNFDSQVWPNLDRIIKIYFYSIFSLHFYSFFASRNACEVIFVFKSKLLIFLHQN